MGCVAYIGHKCAKIGLPLMESIQPVMVGAEAFWADFAHESLLGTSGTTRRRQGCRSGRQANDATRELVHHDENWLQNDNRTGNPLPANEQGTQTSDDTIRRAQVGGTFAATIED